MKKIRIISIAGSGRSGSTILSILLSQNKDVFNLGQSRDLWKALSRDAVCSCSDELKCCKFWSQVVSDGNGGTHIDYPQLNSRYLSFMQSAKKLSNWMNAEAVKSLRLKHHDYFERLQKLSTSFGEVSGADTFVDSSKSPEIALAFSLLENVDVYVLNLVRDPRAVACSWEKKHNNREKTIRFCKEWKRRQDVLHNWSQVLGDNYLRVRYEDFTRAPRKTLADILNWAGADDSTDYFSSERTATMSWDNQHLFPPTNEAVLEKKETEISISGPQEWKKSKYSQIHDAAILHTSPTGAEYIYELGQEGSIT